MQDSATKTKRNRTKTTATKRIATKKISNQDIEIDTSELADRADFEASKSETATTSQTPETEEKKDKKYFFAFVDMEKVKTDNPETLEILKLRATKQRIENNEETAKKILDSIDNEALRLHNADINQEFLKGAVKISESIRNSYIENEYISFKQLICIFNVLYGLSKCFLKV